jgi:hypothetical protein
MKGQEGNKLPVSCFSVPTIYISENGADVHSSFRAENVRNKSRAFPSFSNGEKIQFQKL